MFKGGNLMAKKNKKTLSLLPRKDGIIQFDEVPITIKGDNLTLPSKTVLKVKECSLSEAQREVIFDYFLGYLQIERGNYEIGEFKGKILSVHTKTLGSEETLVDPLNLIEADKVDLKKASRDLKAKPSIKNYLYKTILIDIIFNNKNRFPNGFMQIKKDGKTKNMPLLNNGGCCGAYVNNDSVMPFINGSFDELLIIDYVLNDTKVLNWLINKFGQLNLRRIIKELKSARNLIISSETVSDFNTTFTDSELMINEVLKKHKAPKLKLK